MRIYLNVSCLNRPFDDQGQTRIHLEASAVATILERIDSGEWTHVSSEMAMIEIEANSDGERLERLRSLLPDGRAMRKLDEATFRRSQELTELGFKPADAVHLSAAEQSGADVLLSCDDRFCRLAKRHERALAVPVENPLEWLRGNEHGSHT